MSSQKGNVKKTGAQKYQNRFGFKNNLHGTTWQLKQINGVVVTGVCQRCKDAIDWKIKYRKYKQLSQAKTCNKCHERRVLQSYCTICIPCAQTLGVCQKCAEVKEVVLNSGLSAAEQASKDADLKFELSRLSERQRRSFFRLQESGKLSSKSTTTGNRGDGESSCHGNSSGDDPEDDDNEAIHVNNAGDLQNLTADSLSQTSQSIEKRTLTEETKLEASGFQTINPEALEQMTVPEGDAGLM